jgi:hypothetical protein
LHLHKWGFLHWKIMGIPTSFIWIIILFDEAFKYCDDAKFWSFVVAHAELLCV